MENSERNPFEGIEYIAITQRFAAYRNRWAPFPPNHFIGTFATLAEAIHARKQHLQTYINKRVRETATLQQHSETRPLNA